MTEPVRALSTTKPRIERLKQMAVRAGMKTLRQNGWQCVAAGMTTPAEVLYVTAKDEVCAFADAGIAHDSAMPVG